MEDFELELLQQTKKNPAVQGVNTILESSDSAENSSDLAIQIKFEESETNDLNSLDFSPP